MNMIDLLTALIIFIVIITLMIILRIKLLKNTEIKQSDILIAIIPIILWLLLTGKIEKFEFGDLKIQTAFLEASTSPITKQITPLKLPVRTITIDEKRGTEQIPRLIRNKTEALIFVLDYGHYYGPAIEEYLKRLSEHHFFNYIIIIDSNEKFIGIVNARELNTIFLSRQASFNSHDFANWINNSNITALEKLPGYLPIKNAIKKDMDKHTVLEKMETLNIDILPVIDENDKFVGIVERARLTASLIIDVAKKVK